MSRLNAIGNINRKYAGSGINQLAIDTSSNNVNPGDNFTSVNNNVVGNNLIGTSVLNADGRSSLDQVDPSHKELSYITSNANPYLPQQSHFNTINPNSPSSQSYVTDQNTKIPFTRERRSLRPKQYWEAPTAAQQSDGPADRSVRKGYISDESTRHRRFCNRNCWLWTLVGLGLLILLALVFFGSKFFSSQTNKQSSKGAIDTPNKSKSAQTSTGDNSNTDKVLDNSESKPTITEKMPQPVKESTNTVQPSNVSTDTNNNNSTINVTPDTTPVSQPSTIISTDKCSPTFFRWNGRCIHCSDDSPWNGTNCVKKTTIQSNTTEQSRTVTAPEPQSKSNNSIGDVRPKKAESNFDSASTTDKANSSQSSNDSLTVILLNPNNVPILNHWRHPVRHLTTDRVY